MSSIKKFHFLCAILAVFLSVIVLAATNTYAGEETESISQTDPQSIETFKSIDEGNRHIEDREKETGVHIPLSDRLKAFFSVDLPKGDRTEELASKIRNDTNYTNYRALFSIRIAL